MGEAGEKVTLDGILHRYMYPNVRDELGGWHDPVVQLPIAIDL